MQRLGTNESREPSQVADVVISQGIAAIGGQAGSITLLSEDGDELRLEQVLQNLIQNAIKYSPPGAPVAVRIERQGTDASVAVVDRGIGIPEVALALLFQRFYRAPNVDDRQISGMGIGLFVVKEIVMLHDGTVDVESAEGQGSTFTIRLPLMPE